jgi:hypothetical protein
MTIGEVADYLKVTERTIYRLAGPSRSSPLRWAAVGGFRKQISILGSVYKQKILI